MNKKYEMIHKSIEILESCEIQKIQMIPREIVRNRWHSLHSNNQRIIKIQKIQKNTTGNFGNPLNIESQRTCDDSKGSF